MKVIAAFLIVAWAQTLNADGYVLTSSWAQADRARWCPVHAPFSIRKSVSKVEFVPPRRGAFSVAETSISLPSMGSSGLQLQLSAAGATMPSFWRFSLTPTSSTRRRKVRFVAPVEVPSGGVERTVFVPWSAFLGQILRIGGVNQCDSRDECVFRPERMSHLSVLWSRKGGIEEPTLILHKMEAMASSTMLPVSTWKPAAAPLGDTSCSCDANCVRCLAHSWTPVVRQSCDSYTTSDMCLSVRRSLAERVVAGLGGRQDSCRSSFPGAKDAAAPGAKDAVQWLVSTLDVTNCIGGHPAVPAKLLGNVLQAVFSVALPEPTAACKAGGTAVLSSVNDFLGPFVGYGISGHNDLAKTESETASTCLEKCRSEPRCKSIDYGSRDSVQGECWLSTADRFTAASSYSGKWHLYDYYERVTVSKGKQAVNTGSMIKSLSLARRAELLKGQMGIGDCCANPDGCLQTAINAGVPLYNRGDHLGCTVVYHAVAERLAECPSAANSTLPGVQGMMRATANMSEMDVHPGDAAWRLRNAFDSNYLMRGQCKKSGQSPAQSLSKPPQSASAANTPSTNATMAKSGNPGKPSPIINPSASGSWQGGVLFLLPSLFGVFCS